MIEVPTAGANDTNSLVTLPPTSLIICSRNRPKLLEETIKSILQGNEVPTEIVIIDQSDQRHPGLANGQPDHNCQLRYLWSQSTGLSRANNLGAAVAQYQLLAFTHDDVLVAPQWFGTLIRALCSAGPQSVVTGQVRVTEPEQPGGFQLTLKVEAAPAVYEGRVGKDVLLPLNMAMYRSAMDKVGTFDTGIGPGTDFPAAEDNDFGFRLLEAGYRIIYVPQAVLYHRAWRPNRDYLRLRWSYGVGRGAFYAKHLHLRDRYMLSRVIRDINNHILSIPYLFLCERRRAYGNAILVAGILFGAIKWQLTRRKID